MKNRKGFVPIVIVGFIAALAIALTVVAFYYNTRKQEENSLENDSVALITSFEKCATAGYPVMESYPRQCSAGGRTFIEVVANSNTTTNSNAAPTSGWKTYTSTKYGYSFKYPANWKETDYASSVDSPINSDGVKFEDPAGVDGSFLWIQGGYVPFQDGQWDSATTSVTVGGRTASQIMYSPKTGQTWANGEPFSRAKVSLTTNPISWGVEASFGLAEGTSKSLTTLNTILSTVTFIDETVGWKTYTNDDFDFSLKYPADWAVNEATAQGSTAVAISFEKGNTLKLVIMPKGEFDHGLPEVKKQETVTIGGESVTKTTFADTNSYFFYKFTNIIEGGWTTNNRIELTSADLTLTDKILSTFTFID